MINMLSLWYPFQLLNQVFNFYETLYDIMNSEILPTSNFDAYSQ
jgi:hypothetical protein